MAIEAMACKVPVLAFAETPLVEVIKAPLGGRILPSKDSVALANAIHQFMADDKLRKETGETARDLVKKEYSLDLYAQRHAKVYDQVYEKFYRSTKG